MKQPISKLKEWFGAFKVPTAIQFADWIDSFWHKDSKIPAANIEGWTDDSAVELPEGQLELPTLEDKNKYIQVYGGATGTTYTYQGTPYPIDADHQAILFWSGADQTYRKQSEVPMAKDPSSVKKADVVGEASNNIYNYETDAVNFIINNSGAKVFGLNARTGMIALSEGHKYINFKLVKDPAQPVNKYYSFFDINDVQIAGKFGIANSNSTPTAGVTVEIPEGAKKVYFTSKNANEIDTIRPSHMVNYGQSSLPFIPFNGTLSKVGDKYLSEYAKKQEVDSLALTENLPNPNYLKSVNRYVNWYISTSPNAGISFGNNYAIWFFMIPEIKPMTVSNWFTSRGGELAFFSGAMPTTPSTGVNASVVRSGTLGQLGIAAKVAGQTTFTPPAGSTWGAITIKGTTDNDSVYSDLQIEYGLDSTPPVNGDDYDAVVIKLQEKDLSAKYIQDNVGNQLSFDKLKASLAVQKRIKVSGDGQYINISYPLGDGVVNHKMWVFKTLAVDYPSVIDFSDVSFNDTVIHKQADVVAPLRIEGTTIGGNHGYFKTRVTANGHGKTNVDVGSVWTDGTDQFVIVNIYDVNNFDISSRYGNIELWAGTTLTHVSGATNTATVIASAKVKWQMYPCIKDRVVQYFIDGQEVTVTNKTSVSAQESVTISESYSILRKSSIMEWFISKVGTSTKIIQVDGLPIVRVNNSYTFKGDGNVLINPSILPLEDINQVQDVMFLMNNEFTPQSNIKFYIPGTIPFTANSVNYNFTNLTEIPNDLPFRINITPSRTDNSLGYPNRMIQLGGSWGFAFGYLPVYDTTDTNRKINADRKALQLSEIRKTYMSAIDSDSLLTFAKGQYYSGACYKSYFMKGNETANYIVDYSDFYIWFLDFHSFGLKIISVPPKLIGKSFEIQEKTSNIILYSEQLTSEIQLNVTEIRNYGYLIIKVDK